MGQFVLANRGLRFSVDSLLLGEIGERLVTKNYIAVAELVKNAYDADATEVIVSFINTRNDEAEEKSEIRIDDNGNGMNFKQIKKFWMRIATPNKRENDITPRFGRNKTGSKGIGRFACARLAKKLVLESTGKRDEDNKFDYTQVMFDWDAYEPGTTLTDIPNEYSTKTVKKQATRTTLRLVDLRESWYKKEFDVLRRQILSLAMVTPTKREGYEEDPGFDVTLNAPEFKKGDGKLSEQVMSAGWGRLKGSVSKDGTVIFELEAMKIGEVEYELAKKFTKIPHVRFDIAIIQNVKEYCRDKSTLALYSIRDIFQNWSGVKVFLDGFRIYPYGDPGDDWLGIDERQARRIGRIDPTFERICDNLLGVDKSRALLNQPRNQNLVGRVILSNKPEWIFNVPISREGFIENDASEELKELLRKAIAWATIYYNHFLYIRKREQLESVVEEFKEITEPHVKEIPKVLDTALVVLNEAYKDYRDKVPSSKRAIAGKHFSKAIDVVKESTSYLNRQITTLRTIASTGALMFVFSHEAYDVVSRLGTISNKLELLTKYVSEDKRPELLELSDLMRKTRNRFNNQIKLFSGISSNLADMKKRKIALRKLSNEVIDCYFGLVDRFSIKVENEIPKSLRTGLMLEAEVYSILINLVSNAVKVVIAGYGNRIKLKAEKVDDEIVLRVYDDGIGIPEQSRNLVLKMSVADPENRLYPVLSERLGTEEILSVGEGSGLGLNIVYEILKSYGKSIQFVDVQKPWKTCVEVTLPS